MGGQEKFAKMILLITKHFYSSLRSCLHGKKSPAEPPVKRVHRLAAKVQIFVDVIFENVTWYNSGFLAQKKVNMVAIRHVALLISLNLTALFSSILQIHGIITLRNINEKSLQDLATGMNLRKCYIYLPKLRRIKQRQIFHKERVVGTPQTVLKIDG